MSCLVPLFHVRTFIAALLVLGGTITSPVYARGSSSLSRVRRIVQAQQKQNISNLQKRLEQARQALTSTETQASSLSGDVQSAQMKLQAAKTQVEDDEKESHEIVRRLHELEASILAQQGPDSPFGQAQSSLEKAQQALNDRMHQVLNLAPPSGNVTEEDRMHEYSHLTSEQRSKLKADADYQQAEESVHNASSFLASVRHETLSQDRLWQQAQEDLKNIHERMKTSEANQRLAGREVSAANQKLQMARQQMLAAQQIITQTQAQLLSMGAKPAASTSK
jgi:chromosome segregation ATPase